MLAESEARLTALADEIRQQLRGAKSNLPPSVFSAVVRELALLKWRWESGEHPAITDEPPRESPARPPA